MYFDNKIKYRMFFNEALKPELLGKLFIRLMLLAAAAGSSDLTAFWGFMGNEGSQRWNVNFPSE